MLTAVIPLRSVAMLINIGLIPFQRNAVRGKRATLSDEPMRADISNQNNNNHATRHRGSSAVQSEGNNKDHIAIASLPLTLHPCVLLPLHSHTRQQLQLQPINSLQVNACSLQMHPCCSHTTDAILDTKCIWTAQILNPKRSTSLTILCITIRQ